jgi:hypothetical protein
VGKRNVWKGSLLQEKVVRPCGTYLGTVEWCAGSMIPGQAETRHQSVIIHTTISLSVDTKDL